MSFLLGIIYLSFISLGLPDALLGSAWPNMYPEFQVPVSYAGMISMIIAFGTILSSLQSDRLTRRFGTGKVTAASVGITALALWGFSVSHSFLQLCLWAIPYGLGAVLTGGAAWNKGYRVISLLQIVLTAVLIISLPKWKEENPAGEETKGGKPLTFREIISIPGAKAIMVCFFCYCAVEQTTMLWASSYLNLAKGVDARTAASFAGMFCIGITIGRGINGFIAMKLKDRQMIRMGQAIIIMILPFGQAVSLIGFSLIGLGCAPIYPCIIHSTPEHFGAERSQAIIGVQMASAYIGTCLMPPLFGLIANHISIRLLPLYLLILLVLMVYMHEMLERKVHYES